MLDKQERVVIGLTLSISTIMVIAVVILAVVYRQPAEPTAAEAAQKVRKDPQRQYPQQAPGSQSNYETAAPKSHETAAPKSRRTAARKNHKTASIKDIIRAAGSWRPIYRYWYGRMASDFTLTDINGRRHKLSSYHGKDVLLIFWATWCGPCRVEIPHLIELRKTVSEDELAMLAISNEGTALLKRFVAEQKINYTVLSDASTLPSPYNQVRAIPASFFIDTEGKIKLAVEGMMSLGEIKAVLEAE